MTIEESIHENTNDHSSPDLFDAEEFHFIFLPECALKTNLQIKTQNIKRNANLVNSILDNETETQGKRWKPTIMLSEEEIEIISNRWTQDLEGDDFLIRFIHDDDIIDFVRDIEQAIKAKTKEQDNG